MKTKTLVGSVLVAAIVAVVILKRSPTHEPAAALSPAAGEIAPRPDNPPNPAPTSPAVAPVASAPAATSPTPPDQKTKLANGEWVETRDMIDRGKASPAQSLESFLAAQEAGDPKKLAETLFLTAEARAKATAWFESLPPELRPKFESPEGLLASFMIGGPAAAGKKANDQITWRHQIDSQESGATSFTLMSGLPESTASDPAYHTLRTKSRSSANGKGTDPIYVFHQTDEGWRYVVSPALVDALKRMASKPPAKK